MVIAYHRQICRGDACLPAVGTRARAVLPILSLTMIPALIIEVLIVSTKVETSVSVVMFIRQQTTVILHVKLTWLNAPLIIMQKDKSSMKCALVRADTPCLLVMPLLLVERLASLVKPVAPR
jgi:hypothetical protein